MSKRAYWSVGLIFFLLLFIGVFWYVAYVGKDDQVSQSDVITKPQYNIVLIISDQEAYRLAAAKDYRLPAREELASHGVLFRNHYTAAGMCSPSRASLLTGVPPQVHGVFDQEEYSYVPILDPKRPNMGSVMKQLGYRTAYYGKFEMDRKYLYPSSTVNYSTLIQPYGFDIFNDDGDVGGQPQQGYTHDPYFVGEAVRWLRKNAKTSEKKPFFIVVSLLNPHDIMYADANLPNTVQAQIDQSHVILPPPANSIYQTTWDFALPISLNESLTAKGMPSALEQYQQGWSGALGYIPTARNDMWKFYYNYYLNTIRDNDQNLQLVINTMNDMDLWKNTIVILTSDHGEMGGAHGGLRSKGPMAYEENVHVPLIIAHPDAPKGVTSNVLTSHLDMLPTLVGFANLSESITDEVNRMFPGHDFSKLLLKPSTAEVNAVRKGVLFNYVGISTIDGKYFLDTLVSSFSHKTLPPLGEVDLSKRGFLSFVFDGRYKFARFYAPDHLNTPTTIEEIVGSNDIQLFDLQNDPSEVNNLALDPEKNKDVILQMNALLNELMEKEVGKNNIAFLRLHKK